MFTAINFDIVADIYDAYVSSGIDIPFFLRETEGYKGNILELMCGTGRVSIPLLEAGRSMTCVDYSAGMLKQFESKIKDKNFNVRLVEMDITKLDLNNKYGMVILPFHSFSEILSTEKQKKTLISISAHMEEKGTFILTLQNPVKRLLHADVTIRNIGKFDLGNGRIMSVSFMNRYDKNENIVTGFQTYEICDLNNKLIEKRILDVCFRPVSDTELRDLIMDTGLEITEMYGDYSYGSFNADSSDFMLYIMVKQV